MGDGVSPAGSIVTFYEGTTTDHRGRTLADIHAFTHHDLEANHDFIQWLFPLPAPSPVNPAAPTLDAATIAAFHARPELRAALRRSFGVMLHFHGFEIRHTAHAEGAAREAQADRAAAIVPAPHWEAAARNWLTRSNHNFLRITRILHSLTLLGERELAVAFLAALEKVYDRHADVVGATTIGYWRRAVGS